MSVSPSTSAAARMLSRSSCPVTTPERRASISFVKYSYSSPSATRLSISMSGSAVPTAASDHSRKRSQSSGGAPSISAIIRVGSGEAISSANSSGLGRVDVVEDAFDDLAHLRLQQRHLAAGEARVDELAELPVPRRVGEDQVALLNGLQVGPGRGW